MWTCSSGADPPFGDAAVVKGLVASHWHDRTEAKMYADADRITTNGADRCRWSASGPTAGHPPLAQWLTPTGTVAHRQAEQ